MRRLLLFYFICLFWTPFSHGRTADECFVRTYDLEAWKEMPVFWGRFIEDDANIRSASALIKKNFSSVGEAKMWNANVIADLAKPIKSTHPTRVSSINKSQAQELYDWVSNHPVASLCSLKKYDPSGEIGFCFGRATAVHLEAIRRGVQKDKIYKLWAVGEFAGGDGWHVTTVIQAKDGSFWAIDPVMGRIMKVDEWRERLEAGDPKMRLYLSKPSKLTPGGPTGRAGTYADIGSSEWTGYFRDLMRQFRAEAPWYQQRRWDQSTPSPSSSSRPSN